MEAEIRPLQIARQSTGVDHCLRISDGASAVVLRVAPECWCAFHAALAAALQHPGIYPVHRTEKERLPHE